MPTSEHIKPWLPPNSVVKGRGRLIIRISRMNGECSGLLFSSFILSFFCLSSSIFYVQWNLYLSFPDNSFSRIHRSISMVPEQILFQLWLPHLLFSRIHCFFFRPSTKMMNRGFTVIKNKVTVHFICTRIIYYIHYTHTYYRVYEKQVLYRRFKGFSTAILAIHDFGFMPHL
jgi:hypothetical protein